MPACTHTRRSYKRALVAIAAELEAQAQAADAAGDAGCGFWPRALMPEVNRQLSKMAGVTLPEAKTELRTLAPDDPLRSLVVTARAASYDAAKVRQARKAWSKVDDELAARLAAAEQQIRDLQTENARLRAITNEAAPWTVVEPEPWDAAYVDRAFD